MRRLLLLLMFLLVGAGSAEKQRLTVERDGLNLIVRPFGEPLADYNNLLWSAFDLQDSPTPPITEGLFTLYGYSELAWGVVNLRAGNYEQCLGYGTCVRHERGDLFVFLRDCGVVRFRECLADRGYAGVVALKGDDIGRQALASFWDSERRRWTRPVRVLVLDSLGAGWDRLRDTAHPLNDAVWMRWVGDVSKDTLEAVGLSRLVENNWSGFVRLEFEEVWDYKVVWPDYGDGS